MLMRHVLVRRSTFLICRQNCRDNQVLEMRFYCEATGHWMCLNYQLLRMNRNLLSKMPPMPYRRLHHCLSQPPRLTVNLTRWLNWMKLAYDVYFSQGDCYIGRREAIFVLLHFSILEFVRFFNIILSKIVCLQ